MKTTLWEPANSIGKAATVDIEHQGRQVKINFYWSILEASLKPKSDEDRVIEIREFLTKHPLTETAVGDIFHLESRNGRFDVIDDPKWDPAQIKIN